MGVILAIVGVIATALLGASNPYGTSTVAVPNNQQIGQESCMPRLNKNRLIQAKVSDINPDLTAVYKNNPRTQFNKEGKTWVLVKENAPIPAWKVTLENRSMSSGRTAQDPNLGEMERLGISQPVSGDTTNPDTNGKDIYIGIGWCNPETGQGYGLGSGSSTSCLDPLVQDVLYVVASQGAVTASEAWLTDHGWPTSPNPNPPRTAENLKKYWWNFNVYYDASKLPANATFNDLPCWMKLQCPNGGDIMGNNRLTLATQPDCQVGNVLGATDDQRPRLIINKNEIIITNRPSGITIADYYISMGKLPDPPDNDPIIGTGYASHFNIRIRKGTVSGTSADHMLILDPRLSNHDGPYWTFYPITGTSKPLANTLQLGTFTPGIPSFFYEWWTPSCKPALYFYPEKKTELSVKVAPNGHIIKSIPEHGTDGWKVVAYPDGTIVAGLVLADKKATTRVATTTYPYLYYEAGVKNVSVPKDTGWIKQSDELLVFFTNVLPKLGLNEKEKKDFIDYWLPKLTSEGHNWYITLIEREELDRVEPIEIFPKPDKFIRIRFYFEKIDENEIAKLRNYEIFINLSPITDNRLSTTKPRSGFVAIDWGGIIANGSCGEEEVSR